MSPPDERSRPASAHEIGQKAWHSAGETLTEFANSRHHAQNGVFSSAFLPGTGDAVCLGGLFFGAIWRCILVSSRRLSRHLRPAGRAPELILNDGRVLEGGFVAVAAVADTNGRAGPDRPGDAHRGVRQPSHPHDGSQAGRAKDRAGAAAVVGAVHDQSAGGRQRRRNSIDRLDSAGHAVRRLWPPHLYDRHDSRPSESCSGPHRITPLWCSVQSLRTHSKNYLLDMRLATTSILRLRAQPRDQRRHRPQEGERSAQALDMQAERFQDAGVELEQAIKDFPNLAELAEEAKGIRKLRDERRLSEKRSAARPANICWPTTCSEFPGQRR